MAPFRFRYERLLQLALQRERQQAYVVGRKMAEVIRQREKLQALGRQWAEARQTWLGEVGQGGRAADLSAGLRWLLALEGRIEQENRTLRRLVAELDLERARLVETVKRRRIFEKLKEKHRGAFEERERRLEQRTLDEIASLADWRSRSETVDAVRTQDTQG
ncbi:MAG: flagellar export protein FliJ [candidate division KSB1 bacterium]|nr:flagellar export protein FliJ [candidate division KSB1 bacterium]